MNVQQLSAVRVTDTSLRDGSHAKRHQFTEDHVRNVVRALDAVGVPIIEVSHGDGLGGSSFNYGRSLVPEQTLISAAVAASANAKVAALMLPGVATKDDMKQSAALGVSVIRVATHCTEADIADQHFALARELGLSTVGFLMMAHSQPPEMLARQARTMVDAGSECVYIVDSAGALILEDVTDRVGALVAEIGSEAEVGFHGHENLGLSVANSVLAVRAGATRIDGSARAYGAGAGNTPLEVFAAVCDRIGVETGLNVLGLIDVAEDVVRPIMDDECIKDRMSIIMGYAGVYSSFLRHAYRAAERYGVSGADILVRCGEDHLVGGQEDQIIQIAAELAAAETS